MDRRHFLEFGTAALGLSVLESGNSLLPVDEVVPVRLSDGRQLAYLTYGDPKGWPVLFFHGIPTSKLEARWFDTAAKRHGCRLIAIDRPGYGSSDFQPERQIVDWLNDVQEFLASPQLPADLRFKEFSIACFSSGAAYALCCARHFGRDQLKSVGVVSGIAPLQKISGSGGVAQLAFGIAKRNPQLARALFDSSTRQMQRNPERVLRRISKFFSKCDASVFFDHHGAKILCDSYLDCVRCGSQGVVHDMGILACPWGFDLKQIQMPVSLWYGSCDITTPSHSMATYLNRAIADSELTVLPNEGHLSMLNRAGDSLFSWLLNAR